jgi:hypothetical protein
MIRLPAEDLGGPNLSRPETLVSCRTMLTARASRSASHLLSAASSPHRRLPKTARSAKAWYRTPPARASVFCAAIGRLASVITRSSPGHTAEGGIARLRDAHSCAENPPETG